jgi:hypothetical protein
MFFKIQDIPLALADWQYGLLVLSTVLIAAGGYVINILDQKTDAINKPNNVIIGKNISETNAYPLYGTYGCWRSNWFYLSNVILKPSFAAVLFFDRCHSLFVCNKFETNTNCWQYHSGNSTVLQRHYHWYF